MMAEIKKDLTLLEARGLIRLARLVPELEYLFHHALVQDAVYSSILISDRERIHNAVGRTIERLFPDRLDKYSSELAQHFEAAGEERLALDYHVQAGDRAAAIYANAEAASHYRRAVKIAIEYEDSGDILLHLCNKLGRTLELMADFDGALDQYKAMESLGQERDEPQLSLIALMGTAGLRTTFSPVHDMEQGKALTEKALAMAQELEDRKAQVAIMWNLSNLHILSGRLSQARDLGEQALDLACDLGLDEQAASILIDLTHIYLSTGPLSRAKERIRDSRQLWRKLGNLPMLADSLSTSGGVLNAMGEHDQALAYAEEALEIGLSIENRWSQAYARVVIGFNSKDLGLYGKAIENLEESVRICESLDLKIVAIYAHLTLSGVFSAMGEFARGVSEAEAGLVTAESNLPHMTTFAYATLAQAHMDRGNLAEAEQIVQLGSVRALGEERTRFVTMLRIVEDHVALKMGRYKQVISGSDQHLATLRSLNMNSQIPRVLSIRAHAFHALRMEVDARESLEEARELSESMGARPLLWPVLAKLSQLEEASSNWDRAKRLKEEARDVISGIASTIPAPYRNTFLDIPAVKKLVLSDHQM
jgi:tetratricopeptide (TPR) repeat protein